jgi:hypothetical protein
MPDVVTKSLAAPNATERQARDAVLNIATGKNAPFWGGNKYG